MKARYIQTTTPDELSSVSDALSSVSVTGKVTTTKAFIVPTTYLSVLGMDTGCSSSLGHKSDLTMWDHWVMWEDGSLKRRAVDTGSRGLAMEPS